MLVPVLAAGGAVWVLRTKGSPEETASDFLAAWSRSDYAAMWALTADPPADFQRVYDRFRDDLKLTSARFTVQGKATGSGDHGGGTVRFRAAIDAAVDFSYDGELRLVERDRAWRVAWTPAAVHPRLAGGARFRVSTAKPEPAPITAADGTRIDDGSAPGSVQQLVDALKEQYGSRLAGTPATRVELVGADGKADTIAAAEKSAGEALTTTIDLDVHRAGAQALEDVSKPASLVALRPSTGEILAVVNKPGGFNRALLGTYPPGSTFKVVTASALVADGMSATQTVKCPAEQTIGGFTFHNSHYKDFGALPLRDAFAHSCNTTFGDLAVNRLGGKRMSEVAADFGFGQPIQPGVPAVRAQFPEPKGETDLASAAIGQGRVLASPLNMAAVAAAVADGTWRPPRLVPAGLVPPGGSAPRKLEPGVVAALRQLMPAVVTEGTARGIAFPSGTAGKTGTAEYGSGKEPPTHSWFIGYRGDLAFAVIVEGAGMGSAVAAPAAARFLNGLSAR
ncbi:penicillin-binding transpeptidase domain-containing protein [Microtetraspora sp. NBRC 16547]|uniref:penicillin-binding transpeptidase domain-containing protein n=1 Tax=Microtetraspora sp. NBRC 16547 TaxID=3030993 RepID=UPI002552785D|nr:penicillin-binding transpeptidase domain-containing protein [Microtetraspora sp. NBRC 16547]